MRGGRPRPTTVSIWKSLLNSGTGRDAVGRGRSISQTYARCDHGCLQHILDRDQIRDWKKRPICEFLKRKTKISILYLVGSRRATRTRQLGSHWPRTNRRPRPRSSGRPARRYAKRSSHERQRLSLSLSLSLSLDGSSRGTRPHTQQVSASESENACSGEPSRTSVDSVLAAARQTAPRTSDRAPHASPFSSRNVCIWAF